MENRKYQTVSIWIFPDHYVVRGFHRGASHFVAKSDTLQEAAAIALATDRKQLTVGLTPAKAAFDEFAETAATLLTGGAQ